MKSKIFFIFFLLSLFLSACNTEPVYTSGETLLEDDFSTGKYQWTTLSNDGGIMGYNTNGFRFLIKEPGLNYWATPGLEFKDVRIEVDVLQFSGPVENRVGVICRHKDDDNFYFFVISADGYYAIGEVKDGEKKLLGQDAMKYSSAIKKELAINHLQADCQGNTLRFYVNETPIALVQDFDFTNGDVGILAGTFEEGGLDVIFDNFLVMQP